MLKGIHLTLLAGPGLAVPVPQSVVDALTEVEIVSESGSTQSGAALKFRLEKDSPLHTLFLLAGGSLPPIFRVILVATVNGTPEVLADGVVTKTQVSPGGAASPATLTVTLKDLSEVMNWIDFNGVPYPAMPPEARVLLILSKYAPLGIIPMVIPSVMPDIPIPIDRVPLHEGKDLPYVRQLAEDCGYVFYVAPGPTPGLSVAYWGPEIKVGVPQRALNIDMDAHTNCLSLDFNFNQGRARLPVLMVQIPATKVSIPIPIPDVSLTNPPLGAIPPFPKRIDILSETAKYSAIQAALFGLGQASRAQDAVEGSGSLDVLRYGAILKSRQLVGVRGAGPAFDGLYYVKSVTSSLKRGEFRQSFNLARNGLLSTVPNVPA